MLKTIVATATLLTITFGASAYAGGYSGSMGANGISLNGLGINGMGLNAITANGVNPIGTAPAASSFAIDGIELPAQAR